MPEEASSAARLEPTTLRSAFAHGCARMHLHGSVLPALHMNLRPGKIAGWSDPHKAVAILAFQVFPWLGLQHDATRTWYILINLC